MSVGAIDYWNVCVFFGQRYTLNVLESQTNGCLNNVMNGTAFFLPCNSGSIFSNSNLTLGEEKKI